MKDDKTSAHPLSLILQLMDDPGRPGKLKSASLDLLKPTPQLPEEPRKNVEQTDRKAIHKIILRIQLRMHHTKQEHKSAGVSYQTSK